MTTTTTETYDRDLAQATELLDAQARRDGFPEGERAKRIADVLNNTWIEGITVDEWVRIAAAQV